QIELRADSCEPRHIRRVRRAGPPHPGTGGKNLKCIRPEFMCLQRRLFQGPLTACMDSNAQNFIVTRMLMWGRLVTCPGASAITGGFSHVHPTVARSGNRLLVAWSKALDLGSHQAP